VSTEVQPEGQQDGHQVGHRDVGLDGGISDGLVRTRRFFTKGTVSDDLRTLSIHRPMA
jgi:nitrate reductase alpha subunit